jgi:UDP-2-acetamido-2,6-beta-L-arabino-hexul-4-ose reductase
MLKIGITGQGGFIGAHLFNMLGLYPEKFERVEFKKEFFFEDHLLDLFVLKCDVIIHLAGLNRHNVPQIIYETNIGLVDSLIASLERTKSKAHVIMSSSSQEEKDNLYGESKKIGREKLATWAVNNNNCFTGLIIPNVFGPFGNPYYNSVIATFAYQLTHGEHPNVINDLELDLIYVGDLVSEILNVIKRKINNSFLVVSATSKSKVSELLVSLKIFKETYFDRGEVPEIKNSFELNLFNTFRSYIDHSSFFPVNFFKHSDNRGTFFEVIRLGVGGQVSFSTTLSGETRGNHFHTRKIERFAVIKGKALIQLRRIGTNEVLNFYLDGDEPAYMDMPIWYTHNIKNIGDDTLYTIFWINEPFDTNDPDTYFEIV